MIDRCLCCEVLRTVVRGGWARVKKESGFVESVIVVVPFPACNICLEPAGVWRGKELSSTPQFVIKRFTLQHNSW